MKVRLNPAHVLGNAFMAFSFCVLAYIYYPIINVYIFPPKAVVAAPPKKNDKSFQITVPRIHVSAPILANVDPYNPEEYREALTKGVAHAKGTSLPGENSDKGTFLFAHSSDAPWRISHYNTIFVRLGEVQKGDDIIVRRNGADYIYKVIDEKVVSPTEVEYLENVPKNRLVVQTCTPPGTDWQRLLVFADLVRVAK